MDYPRIPNRVALVIDAPGPFVRESKLDDREIAAAAQDQ
jgi:hypothetical protein